MENRVSKKVVIDPYRGGDDIGNTGNNLVEKDFNLEISQYIYNRLKELGIPVSITREDDSTIDIDNRVNKIKSFYGNGSDVIVISNALNSNEDNASIVYALRNNSSLSGKIANELEKANLTVSKYYQRRLPSDTAKDYNQLIRDTANNESLIIYYGNPYNQNEANLLKNNIEDLGEAVVIALANYLQIPYGNGNVANSYYTVVKGDKIFMGNNE